MLSKSSDHKSLILKICIVDLPVNNRYFSIVYVIFWYMAKILIERRMKQQGVKQYKNIWPEIDVYNAMLFFIYSLI